MEQNENTLSVLKIAPGRYCLLLLLWCFRHRVLFLLCVYSTAAFMAKSIH